MTIYSYSKLKCYRQCPRKYKFRYIDKIRTEIKENVELFLGKRVHETLKKLYRDLWYQKTNTLNNLLDFLCNKWHSKWNESIVIVKKRYTQEYYLRVAKRCITDYYHRYYPFDQTRTITLEKRILVDLNGNRDYKLCGYIDRVTKTKDGCYEIHDYKTSSRLPSLEYIQNDRQLAFYAIGIKERYPNVNKVRLIWHFLKFDREIRLFRTDKELEELKNNTIQLIDTIESDEKYPANPSVLCDWCKFKSICNY